VTGKTAFLVLLFVGLTFSAFPDTLAEISSVKIPLGQGEQEKE